MKDTKCEKRRERREEQCLSNTERVASHICPCRVYEREKERERERGREVFWVFPVFSVGHAR